MDTRTDEMLIANLLSQRGLRPELFSKHEMRCGKTPEFKVFGGDDLVFFCEVKSIREDEWLDKQLDEAPPGTIVGGARPDPVYNRISNRIHEAAQQFAAVNPDDSFTNVLALVNHDENAGFVDLISVVTGEAPLEGGGSFPGFRKYSDGRIAEDKSRIHLYLWISTAGIPSFHFNATSREQEDLLCSWFGIDPNQYRKM